MAHRKAKDAPKIFRCDQKFLRERVLSTLRNVSDIVGSSMGPGGKVTAIESDTYGLPNKLTKDGVTIFKSLGHDDPFSHLIIEIARDSAIRTADSAGDGTTSATVLAYSIVENLFTFTDANPKYSPQKAARRISKVVRDVLIPYVDSRSIKITEDNKELLKMVATVSANGDKEMADAVIKAFEEIGFGDASHVTINELSGKPGYEVKRIDGFPIPMGLEDIGKLHPAFINDQANQRCYMDKPLFLLFDGMINDLITIDPLLAAIHEKYAAGNADYKNVVIFAHGFSENVLTTLAFNFSNPGTLNVLPLTTPMMPFLNSQLHFLQDLSAFTGAKVFGLQESLADSTFQDLGCGMASIECYRFRTTIVGDPDPTNVELRAEELKKMKENAASQADRIWIEERLGKITNGIAKLTIFGGSGGELRESHDRCEDAVCAVRSAITYGALPGGCRIAIDLALKLDAEFEENDPARVVLVPALMSLPIKLLENAGHHEEEIAEVLKHLFQDTSVVFDVENQKYGKAEDLGLFDATKAVTESLSNAVSIACVLGTCGGLVCHPRDAEFERSEAKADSEYDRVTSNPNQYVNEANNRA